MDLRTGRIDAKYCGFTRSVFLSATYALACDADYFIYVEQDCLVHGENLLGTLTRDLEHPILLGRRVEGGVGIGGRLAAAHTDQSLMLAHRGGLERYIAGIYAGEEGDGVVSPETKMERDLAPFGYIPIPYGRSRPIDFSRSHFYAQQLTSLELERFSALEGFDEPLGAT